MDKSARRKRVLRFAFRSRVDWPNSVANGPDGVRDVVRTMVRAGADVSATGVALVGYLFGQSWDLLHRWLGRAALFSAALIVAMGVVVLVRRFGAPLLASVGTRLPTRFALRELGFAAASLGAIALFVEIAEDFVTKESTPCDE